jgi:asparagine synthase (glutamine-hydrolysing)
MCGIAGIQFKHDIAPERLDRAATVFASSLRHRGPDDFGLHRSARAVYANLRLAIVDRAAGQQPIYAPGSATRGIVYNGEVYNHDELRALQSDYPFRTHSDTEALLASWLAQGDAAFESWNGMFAACLFDGDVFTLVRDRFGAKPLYVYEDEHCMAFASELRTLLKLEGLDHSLDPVGFQDHLAYRYNLAPHTQFARIRKLGAGSFLHWDGQRRHEQRYADVRMADGPARKSEAAYVEELDGLLQRAVRSQLMGEVPIGVLLSGGLDSSAIAAYVAKNGARLTAYSIGFPEVNEFAFSRDVARAFDLPYVELTLTQDELRAGMDRVIGELDEPIADPACFALSRLAQRIREDVTVVLSGEGGDELFAGYGHHALALRGDLDRDALFGHFFVHSASDLRANELLADKAMPLHHLRHRAAYDRAATPLAGMQAFELATWLPENLMMKADKVLMAHSLEGRFPFLDLELLRFASALPREMKLPHAGSSKHVLRQLMRAQLPNSVIERRKMGFTVPPAFFLQPLQRRLEATIERLRGTRLADVLDLDAARALFAAYYSGQAQPVMRVWNLAVLLLWWADVYPTLRSAPPVAFTSEAGDSPRRKLTVYTVLVGAKEALHDPLCLLAPHQRKSDLDIDWVCLSDDPTLVSPTWRIADIGEQRHLPPEKLSRRPKALPHEYFPDAAFSLYVDNTVSFRRLPQASDLEHDGEFLFRAFRHATRKTPEEEASVVACLGYDDIGVVCGQMEFYEQRRRPSAITPLTTGTVLLREHHHPKVARFGRLWWESILAFSKRDQLSLDFAREEAGIAIQYWSGSTDDNAFVHWNGSLGNQRVQASFDAKRYAWMHRDDAGAQRDPRRHALAAGCATDPRWQRELPRLEYACHLHRSSLGEQVSPRRGVARALQAALDPLTRDGLRFLVVRVQDAADALAFSSDELNAATQALCTHLARAEGTALDLTAADLAASGRVYTLDANRFELIVVLGLPGASVEAATQKLIRMAEPEAGGLVAVLTSPVPLPAAAAAEALIRQLHGAAASTSLQATRHDGAAGGLPNTLLATTWRRPVGNPAAVSANPSSEEIVT